MDSMVDAAHQIERLAPSGTTTNVNPEYPWKYRKPASDDLTVVAPCDYPFDEFDPKTNPRLQKLLTFIDSCFRYLEKE